MKDAVMRGTGEMAICMRLVRALFAVVAAYALVLQPLSMAGAMASQTLHAGFLNLCSADGAERGKTSPGDRSSGDALHGACCCLAAAGGSPWMPASPAASAAPIDFARVSVASLPVAFVALSAIPHPSARPRAPPVVRKHTSSGAGSLLGAA